MLTFECMLNNFLRILIVHLKFCSASSANAKKYLAHTQRKLKIIPFLNFCK
jgi:hypothetical protein